MRLVDNTRLREITDSLINVGAKYVQIILTGMPVDGFALFDEQTAELLVT